ncbi:LysE family translocator [Metabacillus sp. GX 13764]|uniref:LysE family translocator n=1 Tax=Metabacillus kandeliae TaxID=2900151 RepID=UPI001E4918FC|nr:LysE family transporter [Metabacillus kandeliae]MCD7035629.1 LysE family translocator [Metabacillus kandeliae]
MLFLKSIILGFSVSAPIGPIGLLCIQRVLQRGKVAGLLTGFGAVTANILYAAVAALGFSVISAFLLQQQAILKVLGTLFLLYIGVQTLVRKPAKYAANLKGESLFQMYLSTLLLMIANPVTILNFTAMFSGIGFHQGEDTISTVFQLVGGVLIGAAFWWILLSCFVSIFRSRLTAHLGFVNKSAGLMIILLAVLSWMK